MTQFTVYKKCYLQCNVRANCEVFHNQNQAGEKINKTPLHGWLLQYHFNHTF